MSISGSTGVDVHVSFQRFGESANSKNLGLGPMATQLPMQPKLHRGHGLHLSHAASRLGPIASPTSRCLTPPLDPVFCSWPQPSSFLLFSHWLALLCQSNHLSSGRVFVLKRKIRVPERVSHHQKLCIPSASVVTLTLCVPGCKNLQLSRGAKSGTVD